LAFLIGVFERNGSMAFRFRFQSLMRYREHLCSTAQTELANAMRRHERSLELLESARHERRKYQEGLEDRQRSGISVVDYVTGAEYLTFLEQQLLRMEREVQQSAQEVLTAKELVSRRQTEVKRLECLESNERADYRKIQNRRERAQIDESAIVRDARSRRDTPSQD
jgi:flagellar export protein FliJ